MWIDCVERISAAAWRRWRCARYLDQSAALAGRQARLERGDGRLLVLGPYSLMATLVKLHRALAGASQTGPGGNMGMSGYRRCRRACENPEPAAADLSITHLGR